MDRHPWQRRAREAGLSQSRLAELLGVSDNAVSTYLMAAIEAWRIMTPEQREQWLSAVETARREQGGR
jgi:predicted transcriptional regulator